MTEDRVNGVNGVFYWFFVSHGCKLLDFVGFLIIGLGQVQVQLYSAMSTNQSKRKKGGEKLHNNKLSSWLEDEKQVEQNHRFQCEPSRALMIKEDCFSFDVTKTSTD